MKRIVFASAGAALALLSAWPAAAATMSVLMTGDFDSSPYYDAWYANLVYDTRYAVETQLPYGGHELSWNASEGGPSPIYSFNGVIYGRSVTDPHYPIDPSLFPFPDYPLSLGEITDFAFSQGPAGLEIDLNNVFVGYYAPGQPNAAMIGAFGPAVPFSEPHVFNTFGLVGSWRVPSTGGAFVGRVTVTRLDVPEPSSWSLMVLGFLSLGAAVRVNRSRKLIG